MARPPRGNHLSESIENYAKAIYALEQRGDGPVTTNALAAARFGRHLPPRRRAW